MDPIIHVDLIRFNPGQPDIVTPISPVHSSAILPVVNSQVLSLTPPNVNGKGKFISRHGYYSAIYDTSIHEGSHVAYDEINGNGMHPAKRRKYSDNALELSSSERNY